jgi:hypothetical protein
MQRALRFVVLWLVVLVFARLCVELRWIASTATPTHASYRAAMLDVLSRFEQVVAADPRLVYWLTCGTLLGWARTGDVIPFDDDVDVGMPSDALDLLRDDAGLHALLIQHNLSLCFNTGSPVKVFDVHSYTPFVDLIRHWPSSSAAAYWESDWESEGFWNDELFPLRRCMLGDGVATRCPRSPWGFLERVYGGTLSWMLLGRHWTVPLHYSEHTTTRTLPYAPVLPKTNNRDMSCAGGGINVQWADAGPEGILK